MEFGTCCESHRWEAHESAMSQNNGCCYNYNYVYNYNGFFSLVLLTFVTLPIVLLYLMWDSIAAGKIVVF